MLWLVGDAAPVLGASIIALPSQQHEAAQLQHLRWHVCRVGFIDGLQLGGLIGRGGYARVYKGGWAGLGDALSSRAAHWGVFKVKVVAPTISTAASPVPSGWSLTSAASLSPETSVFVVLHWRAGRWKGTTVAVKVVETHLSQDQRLDLRSEPLLRWGALQPGPGVAEHGRKAASTASPLIRLARLPACAPAFLPAA